MKRTKTENDYLFLVDFYLKNQDCRPKEIIKKAQEIDLLKNKFTNTIIYNYFLYFKRYLKDGYFCKGAISVFKNAMEKKVNKPKINQSICKLSLEDRINKIIYDFENKLYETENNYLKIIEKNREKIMNLNRINNEIDCFLKTYKEELENEKHNAIQSLLKGI